jgi:hypothetical protein
MGGCVTKWPISREAVLQRADFVLQEAMAKPPTSVRSIRLPDETWAWLSKEAERRTTTVNGLVAALVAELQTGIVVTYEARRWPDDEPKTTTIRQTVVRDEVVPATDRPKFEGVTASGDPMPKRGAFNPQPKRGQKK